MPTQPKLHIQRGFTVTELTIAVLVMGILAAVVAPNYVAAINRYRADLAARRIAADLRHAQSEAQRTGQSRTVEFDVASNRYSLLNVSNIDVSTRAYNVDLVDDPFVATLISASFGGDADVVFDMYGRPDSDGSVVVQSGNVQQTIDLNADGTTSNP